VCSRLLKRWSSRKEQITFGISTGINNIPTALTIQKGNVQDKTHFDHIFKTVTKVLGEGSILIFDCGANTKQIKNDSQWGHKISLSHFES